MKQEQLLLESIEQSKLEGKIEGKIEGEKIKALTIAETTDLTIEAITELQNND